jgi:lysophospholipase L1-like esterase
MSRKKQQQNETMTPMQHRAVLVCILCVLAVLLTFGITTTLLKKEEPAPSVSEPAEGPAAPGGDLSGHYQIDNASTALLTETADAGTDYLNDTLFLGDSNTVRLYNNGLISLQQFCAKEGIGTQVALNEGIVTFKKDSNHYTIPQAVAMMKPRRVVMTFGTNDTGMEVPDFIAHYTALIQAIQQSYPYTDIIVNTVPPVPADHSNYPHMDQAKIDDFNMALLEMCEQLGVRFLNSAEALKGSDGYGIADYYTSGDIHLKSAGLKAVLNYLRTHALQTEDRRPDTNNIPTRTMEYVSNPSSAVAAPSSEAVSSSESQAESASSSESSSSESTGEGKKFEARYRVDKNGGGTLSVGNDTGNSSVTYTVTDPDKSITVTAVPAEGHVFVKWSDGLTSKTRTDTDFKQNLDVTAVFGTASVHITSEGKGAVGSSYTFKAALSGKYAKTENLRWYANGQEVTQAAGKSSITVVVDSSMVNASYKIHAVVTYNDCKVSSNTLTITIGSGVTSESGSTSSSSSSHAGSSGSTSSSSASSGSSSHSTSSSSSGSSKAEPESESKDESKAESKAEGEAESKAETKSEVSASKEAEGKAE